MINTSIFLQSAIVESQLPTVCVAILNWRGIKYLPSLLSSLLTAVDKYPRECPIIVLDNNEEDDTDRAWIQQNFPIVRVIRAPKNDFLYSYNWLLEQLTEQVVILLNNDIKVDENFLLPLLEHFDNPQVFAASSSSYDWEGKHLTSGPFMFRQHRGWFYTTPDFSKQITCYTLFACGGYMAVDREKFLSLGGFDRLFYPAYGEDLDLCFRAWCRGWKSIYEPNSIVYHDQSGSWNSQDTQKVSQLRLQANLLFQWQNLRQMNFYIHNRLYLLWLIFRKFIQKDKHWLKTYKKASSIWKQNKARASRKQQHSISLKWLKDICGTEINTPIINNK